MCSLCVCVSRKIVYLNEQHHSSVYSINFPHFRIIVQTLCACRREIFWHFLFSFKFHTNQGKKTAIITTGTEKKRDANKINHGFVIMCVLSIDSFQLLFLLFGFHFIVPFEISQKKRVRVRLVYCMCRSRISDFVSL